MRRTIRVFPVLLSLMFFTNVLCASDMLLSMLEKDYDIPLTNDDVGRIFILNCDFSVKNGPVYYAGTHMVLKGANAGCLICAPEGVPNSDEYRILRTKLVRTPFFEGTPAQAYAQLVLEIFTAKDFYMADSSRRTPNPRARRKIFRNIEFYLLAIPSTEETRKRIKCVQSILQGELLVLENYRDEIDELNRREERRRQRETRENESGDNDSGGCFTCPFQRRNQVEKKSRSYAKTSREDRLDIIKDCLDKLYGETETLVDDALSNQDLMLAVAIQLNVRSFTENILCISKKNYYKKTEIRDIREKLDEIQKDLCAKIYDRMQDDGWADASKEYRESFPGVTLIFNLQTPRDEETLRRLLNLSFQAYVGLYCVSPEADFATWGGHCLNYLFFVSGTSWSKKFEDDYRQNLRNFLALQNEGKQGKTSTTEVQK